MIQEALFRLQAKWAKPNLAVMSRLTDSQETLEDWKESPTSTLSRLKSASLPKSLSKSDLWEGIQRKSQDFLKGTGMLMRSNSKDDTSNQQVLSALQHLACLHLIGWNTVLTFFSFLAAYFACWLFIHVLYGQFRSCLNVLFILEFQILLVS